MPINPLALISTLIGGLVLAGLLGWVRRPRLVVLIPRLFLHSQVAIRGQLVEVSIFNRGFKTEESVEVTLNHSLRYELLGSNNQDVKLNANKIYAPRIGPADEVSILLLVESGTFKQEDIVLCLSKDTKGIVVAKPELVPPTGQQRIGLIGALVLVPTLLYAASLGLDYAFEQLNPGSKAAIARAEKRESLEINGWKVPWFEVDQPGLFADFKAGSLSAVVGSPTKKGDVVSVPVSVANSTQRVIRYTLEINSVGSAKRFKSFELSISDVIVVPGGKEQRSVNIVIPQGGGSAAERTAFISLRLTDMEGNSLNLQTQLLVQ
ncbi:UNVERIFIED_CONTAM: hypothetical protein C7454_11735 [Acidovorax defluvii]